MGMFLLFVFLPLTNVNSLQMTRSRQTNRDSLHGSDSSEEDSDERSPRRGRSGNDQTIDEAAEQEKQVNAKIDALMGENSKSSGA